MLCPDPAAPSNGDVTHTSNTVGSLAEYTCSEGYVLVGATSATCVETGLRSAQFRPAAPVCNGMYHVVHGGRGGGGGGWRKQL